jgi:hypothetical protein
MTNSNNTVEVTIFKAEFGNEQNALLEALLTGNQFFSMKLLNE